MTTQKTILVFLVNDFIIGGVQRLYLELFSHLPNDDYELHLVTLIDLPGKTDMYGQIPDYVTIHRLTFKSLFDIHGWKAYRQVIRNIRPDVVVTSLFFANTVSRVTALFKRYPIISIEHNTNTWKTFTQIAVDKLLSYRSSVIVATSRSVQEFAARQGHIALSKFRIIPNGIDLERLKQQAQRASREEVLKEFAFPDDARIVLNVARLTHQKNQPMLLLAFARFIETYPNYRLVILGEGPQRGALEARIQKLGMEGKIILAGSRHDVATYYGSSDFFISTSFIEGFGIAHAEALACGLPLVSTKTAGPDEMIEEGVNGYFTDITVDSMYEGLVRMARDGVSGSKEKIMASVKQFDSSVVAGTYDALIKEVVGQSVSGKPRIALMTYAIDNRPAKGTAKVARKCVEELLLARDKFDLTFIHYERCDDPIYTYGVREVIMPKLPGFLNRRSLRQILYFFTTKDHFDILQWFQPRLYPFFWKAPADHLVVEVHGAGDVAKEAKFNVMRHVFNWTVKTFLHHIRVGIVSSEFAKKDIVEKYGFAPEQVRVIYNGVDPIYVPSTEEAVQQARKTYNLPEVFFLGVARLNPNKNVLRCLQAFDEFCRTTGNTTFHYVNIGANGSEKDEIDAFVAASSYRDRIHFVSYIEEEDFPAVYSAAHTLVFPLLNEGFGLPLIESMACRTPVIVSETAYPEVARDEALLVDALDSHAIAKAMIRITEDEQLHASLAEKGYKRAQTLTWKNMGKGLIALYDELVSPQITSK